MRSTTHRLRLASSPIVCLQSFVFSLEFLRRNETNFRGLLFSHHQLLPCFAFLINLLAFNCATILMLLPRFAWLPFSTVSRPKTVNTTIVVALLYTLYACNLVFDYVYCFLKLKFLIVVRIHIAPPEGLLVFAGV